MCDDSLRGNLATPPRLNQPNKSSLSLTHTQPLLPSATYTWWWYVPYRTLPCTSQLPARKTAPRRPRRLPVAADLPRRASPGKAPTRRRRLTRARACRDYRCGPWATRRSLCGQETPRRAWVAAGEWGRMKVVLNILAITFAKLTTMLRRSFRSFQEQEGVVLR